MAKGNGKQIVSAAAYATVADFKQIFTEDVNSLYLLSLLLTGDPEKAEKCFVEGIGESTKGERCIQRVGAFLGSTYHRSKCDSVDRSAGALRNCVSDCRCRATDR